MMCLRACVYQPGYLWMRGASNAMTKSNTHPCLCKMGVLLSWDWRTSVGLHQATSANHVTHLSQPYHDHTSPPACSSNQPTKHHGHINLISIPYSQPSGTRLGPAVIDPALLQINGSHFEHQPSRHQFDSPTRRPKKLTSYTATDSPVLDDKLTHQYSTTN
ncbi:hypothetical protein VTK56DRAFT_6036 [Thermocarpiscus australiensis]